MSQSVTLVLADDLYQYLHEIANLTRQPVSELAAQSIRGNLPPRPADAPVEMLPELLAMQSLGNAELRQIAVSQLAQKVQQRHEELLEANADNLLSVAERLELATLRQNADRLMLRKAYAWSLLRWRGYPMPTRDEIPVA